MTHHTNKRFCFGKGLVKIYFKSENQKAGIGFKTMWKQSRFKTPRGTCLLNLRNEYVEFSLRKTPWEKEVPQ